jgi:Ser/Thr protein kinase RdoA (MazF antagonist)
MKNPSALASSAETDRSAEIDPRLTRVLPSYSLGAVRGFGEATNGLINKTFHVATSEGLYLAQQINHHVFPDVAGLMNNIDLVTAHIRGKITRSGGDPARQVVNLASTNAGETYATIPILNAETGEEATEYWRVMDCVKGATSLDKVEAPQQMFQVARGFGRFVGLLDDFERTGELVEAIPDFHHTPKRLKALSESYDSPETIQGEPPERENNRLKKHSERKAKSQPLYEEIMALGDRAEAITDLLESGGVKTRVTHNDTKANNAMLDAETGEPLAVIDLDTLMPGSVLYDIGDMARSACNDGDEDDRELSRVAFNEERFAKLVEGYLVGISETGGTLTDAEMDHIVDGVEIMCLELASRFLKDYLDGDIYFGGKYDERPDLNLERARAQFKLAQDVSAKRENLQSIVEKAALNASAKMKSA